MQKVLIEPTTYGQCKEAVAKAFDLFPLEIEGKKVLINPNVLRNSSPEQAVTTHPAILKAVVDQVASRNPSLLVVGDNPGLVSYGANEKAFVDSGLMDAASGYYQNIGTEGVDVDFSAGDFKQLTISRMVQEADVVISVPKFKTHGLTILSGAIKNCYGYILGAQKAKLHYQCRDLQSFSDAVVKVFKLRIPDLFIMDAVVGMEGNGPASTELRFIGQLIAADNAVAMDAVVARLMGLQPEVVPALTMAADQNLGRLEEKEIEIVGKLNPIPDFRLPPRTQLSSANQEQMLELIHSRTLMRPVVDDNRCTACETCVEQCPATALTMQEELPVVDKELCIACFCCQEMCPEAAITLS